MNMKTATEERKPGSEFEELLSELKMRAPGPLAVVEARPSESAPSASEPETKKKEAPEWLRTLLHSQAVPAGAAALAALTALSGLLAPPAAPPIPPIAPTTFHFPAPPALPPLGAMDAAGISTTGPFVTGAAKDGTTWPELVHRIPVAGYLPGEEIVTPGGRVIRVGESFPLKWSGGVRQAKLIAVEPGVISVGDALGDNVVEVVVPTGSDVVLPEATGEAVKIE